MLLSQAIALCFVLAICSSLLSHYLGGSSIVYGLLLGFVTQYILNINGYLIHLERWGSWFLKFGVTLLGFRINLEVFSFIGLDVVFVVGLSVFFSIIIGLLFARWLNLSREEGLIGSVSVAVCGASAAMAMGSLLNQTERNKQFLIATIAIVTLYSSAGLIIYPILLRWLSVDDFIASVLIGGTIHDVAQVVAAGAMMGPEVGDLSIIIKLYRVFLLFPIILIAGLVLGMQSTGKSVAGVSKILPVYLYLFLVLVVLTSFGLVPSKITEVSVFISSFSLTLALVAVGLKTQLSKVIGLGWKVPVFLMAQTLTLIILVLMGLTLI
jgi:uncharacterized integral membrane protein (TIGR00698 family)